MSIATKATVTNIKSVAKNTVEVTLQPNGVFNFNTGQYVSITNPQLSELGILEQFRDMSIASSNTVKDSFKIAFRLSDSAFKKALVEHGPGLVIDISKPSGIFARNISPNSVAIAGGIGITPFMAAMRSEQKFRLAYFNKDASHCAYRKEIDQLLGEGFYNFYEKPSAENLTKIVGKNLDSDYYIAGPPSMVELTKSLLKSLKIRDELVHTEYFSGYDNKVKDPLQKRIAKPNDYQSILATLGAEALVSVTDKKGAITYVNDRFLELNKFTRGELIGQNHRILKSGQQDQSIFEDLWTTISSGRIWRGEIKNRAKDGSYYWVDTSITPIMDDRGKPIQYIAVRSLITSETGLEQE